MPHQTTFCLSPWFLLLCLFDRFFWGKVGKVDLCLLVNIRLWDAKKSQILSKNCDLRQQTSWRAEELKSYCPASVKNCSIQKGAGSQRGNTFPDPDPESFDLCGRKGCRFKVALLSNLWRTPWGHSSASLTRVFNKFEFLRGFYYVSNLEVPWDGLIKHQIFQPLPEIGRKCPNIRK